MSETTTAKNNFDIYIYCPKKNGSNSADTDRLLGKEIYNLILNQGYSVFFDESGEIDQNRKDTIIDSAKIMLVVCASKPSFITAEPTHTAFSDKNKIVIPCFIDANDLPEKLKGIIAVDLTKTNYSMKLTGMITDYLRSASDYTAQSSEATRQKPKTAKAAEKKNDSESVSVSSGSADNLVKRGNISIENDNWEEARIFFDRALNENAETSSAYLGLLKCKYNISQLTAELIYKNPDIINDPDFKNAFRFSSESEQKKLTSLLDDAVDKAMSPVYKKASDMLDKSDNKYQRAFLAEIFNEMGDFRDSRKKAEIARELAV